MPRHAMDQKRFFMGFLDTININAGCGGAKVVRSKEVNRSPASFQGKNNAPVFCASGTRIRGQALGFGVQTSSLPDGRLLNRGTPNPKALYLER